MAHHPPPSLPIPGFPDLRRVAPKTPFPGGLRARWKDGQGNIYEWDYRHGALEKYDSRGRHLGEWEPSTGERLKEASSGRTITP